MKKFLLFAVGSLVVVVVGLVGVAYTKSPEFNVDRSIVIQSDHEKIFPYLNNLPRWQEWTVWTKEKYPNLEPSYKGEEGKGAEYHWTDDNGNGHLIITESNPETGITYDLFFEGFPKSECSLQMAKVDDGTQVRMQMKGSLGGNPLFRVLGLFFDMEDAVGTEFDQCLTKLKKVVEAS